MERIVGYSINELVYGGIIKILASGREVSPRGEKTLEITHVCFELTNVDNCFLFMPKRGNNTAACVAEILWVMAGRNDLNYLKDFLPNCLLFSDNPDSDNPIWRAGYGIRLRRYGGFLDQIKYVVDCLKRDPYSRQAVISIWNPIEDCYTTSKDIPCNNWLHFLVRDGKLDCSVAIRSNDLIWGFSAINVQEWVFLMKLIAASIGVQTGELIVFSDSLHVYERHFEKINEIIKNRIDFPYSKYEFYDFDFEYGNTFDRYLTEYFYMVEAAKNGIPIDHYLDLVSETLLPFFLLPCMYLYKKRDMKEYAISLMKSIPSDHIMYPTAELMLGLKTFQDFI